MSENSIKSVIAYKSDCANANATSEALIFLVSLNSAVDYYRDIIEMEYMGATNIAPGEDGYVFKFSRDNAAAFTRRHESQWGIPTPVDS
ncbi:MAG: hypothetical protein RMY33_004380 [Nostoc sp. DedQUE03]